MQRLDVTGTYCPVPLLMTARVVADLIAGDVLEVVGDDPTMLDDFPAWCEESGHLLRSAKRVGGRIRCVVECRS